MRVSGGGGDDDDDVTGRLPSTPWLATWLHCGMMRVSGGDGGDNGDDDDVAGRLPWTFSLVTRLHCGMMLVNGSDDDGDVKGVAINPMAGYSASMWNDAGKR